MTIDAQRHSDEMAAQRAQELAGDAHHYRLRKACQERAVDLYCGLHEAMLVIGSVPTLSCHFGKLVGLLKDIDDAAK